MLKKWTFFQNFPLKSILARILQSADKFYRFIGEISGKIQFGRNKIEIRSHQLQLTVFVGVKIVQLINLRFLYPFLTS